MNPFDPSVDSESVVLEVEPIPQGMRVAIKMWKWYLFGVVAPFAIINSIAIPSFMIIWLPAMLAVDVAWQSHKNRWALLDSYSAISISSFILGVVHIAVALFILWVCFQNDSLNVISVGFATIPNLIGCWLIIAAILGWRFQQDYSQWLIRQRKNLSVWEKW